MGSPKHTTDLTQDYTIPQAWDEYTPAEHDMWRRLYERQQKLLPGKACDEFMAGLTKLDLNDGGIPDFRRLNEKLHVLTGWTVEAVPDLVPDAAFFQMLAERRFPAGRFIRKPHEMDYLEEPDIFHDVFGHVPMLSHPVFADFMAAYGRGGLRSVEFNALDHLARLYWYTVEFGLVKSPDGLKIYGAGILSSKGESKFSLVNPSPNRIGFNAERVMRTDYKIDDYQQTYFVIESFEALLEECYRDFAPLYERLEKATELRPPAVEDNDTILHRGTQQYFLDKIA